MMSSFPCARQPWSMDHGTTPTLRASSRAADLRFRPSSLFSQPNPDQPTPAKVRAGNCDHNVRNPVARQVPADQPQVTTVSMPRLLAVLVCLFNALLMCCADLELRLRFVQQSEPRSSPVAITTPLPGVPATLARCQDHFCPPYEVPTCCKSLPDVCTTALSQRATSKGQTFV